MKVGVSVASLLWIPSILLALEDITDLDAMNVFIAQKFDPGDTTREKHKSNYRMAPTRKMNTEITVPPDNFDWAYQKLNETIFHQAVNFKTRNDDTYPSLPTFAFNDDPTPLTETDQPENKTISFRNRTLSLSASDDISGYIPRTTTREPFFVQESLQTTERIHRDTARYPLENRSYDEVDENTPPPPPPPDWAVKMMLSSKFDEVIASDNDVTEEPFEVTNALENALTSTLDDVVTTTDWSVSQATEVPTMKMYPWEMQRGDINVHDIAEGQPPSVANPTFMPVSIRTPKYKNEITDNVLIPQEMPSDVDLPKVYTIGPRLILPQLPTEPTRPIPPVAPPTLIMKPSYGERAGVSERPGYNERISYTEKPGYIDRPTPPPQDRNNFRPNFSVPQATPTFTIDDDLFNDGSRNDQFLSPTEYTQKPAPQSSLLQRPSLQNLQNPSHQNPSVRNQGSFSQKADFAPSDNNLTPSGNKKITQNPNYFTPTSFPSFIQEPTVTTEDYGRTDSFERLSTKAYNLPFGDSGPSRPPGTQIHESSGPPGIGFVSAPPSFGPHHVSVTVPPPTSTTPYYTEVLIPKHATSDFRGYSPDLRPRTSNPTTRPQTLEPFTKHLDHRVGVFGRGRTIPTKVYDPNKSSSYFSSVQDRSQMKLLNHQYPPLKLNRVTEKPKKHHDDPQFLQTTPAYNGAVVFRIPKPIKLSMSRAVKTMPVMVGMPKNYLHKRLGLTPQPFFHVPKQKDQKVKAWKSLGPLNWVPIGLGPPKRLGAVKLVPITTKTDNIEVEVLHDDTKQELCKIDDQVDDFQDIRDSHRDYVKKCFRRVKNCLLMDAVPLERRINYKEDQCINFCGHHPYCQSVAYSKVMSICDIFDKRNGTGPIRTVNYIGTTYYEALNSVALDCWRDGLNTLFYTKAPLPAVLVDSNDASGEEERRRQVTKATSNPVMIAPKDYCSTNQDVLLMKSVGFRIRAVGVIPLPQNSSETECVFSCLVNLARGHIPYKCSAASYSNEAGCLIYKSNPKAHQNLIPADSYTHYEKTCVSRSMVELCKGYPIVRQPQRVLLGFTSVTVKAGNLMDCLEMCFVDFQKNGGCKSVMFFYEEKESNCVFNNESAVTQPSYFTEENDSPVDYASFENCVEEVMKEVRHSSLRSQQYRHQETRKKQGKLRSSEKRVTVMSTTSATLPPPVMPRGVFLSVGGTKEISSTRHKLFMDNNNMRRHSRPLSRPHYTDEAFS
ncbi:unnamed protein product [Bursaphelenchus okinawaensis]|uniref:Apple domain-containing protein n=1 Tax=Bursaphelenchus okinawaensis TaxID=465554 RepID=A0A811JSZ7_9BILA|nr:unnamed protein product [Bursaphelenchus okinawaensis]CAG9081631.1 unnamed protein product [Bursaphelenchus okinawaensis]